MFILGTRLEHFFSFNRYHLFFTSPKIFNPGRICSIRKNVVNKSNVTHQNPEDLYFVHNFSQVYNLGLVNTYLTILILKLGAAKYISFRKMYFAKTGGTSKTVPYSHENGFSILSHHTSLFKNKLGLVNLLLYYLIVLNINPTICKIKTDQKSSNIKCNW